MKEIHFKLLVNSKDDTSIPKTIKKVSIVERKE